MSSNYRELLAIFMAVLTFQQDMENMSVQLFSDNITAKSYLVHQGGPDRLLNKISKGIWNILSKRNIAMSCVHIAGLDNVSADQLSRLTEPFNWRLNENMFLALEMIYGPHSIDRFGEWGNHQLPRYNARFRDPGCESVNALAQLNWSQENNYCAPPFSLINNVLDVLIAQKAVATLIAPLWKGSVWMLKLRKMLLSPPTPLPNNISTFQKLNRQAKTPEPLRNPRWRMFAWRVSGALA